MLGQVAASGVRLLTSQASMCKIGPARRRGLDIAIYKPTPRNLLHGSQLHPNQAEGLDTPLLLQVREPDHSHLCLRYQCGPSPSSSCLAAEQTVGIIARNQDTLLKPAPYRLASGVGHEVLSQRRR